MQSWNRRHILKNSGLLAGSRLTSTMPFNQISIAHPVRMNVPAVDEVTIRETTDNAHDVVLQSLDVPGLTVKCKGFSGQNFIDLAKREILEKLVLCGIGGSDTFSAQEQL